MSKYIDFTTGKVNINGKFDKPMTLIPTEVLSDIERKARVDELEKITRLTIEKPITPENKNDATWQGGYNFARNSLKRYKLSRIKELKDNK